MNIGDKVKLKFAGGHIGVITAKKYECSYCIDGKPNAGLFFDVELEPTDEDPQYEPLPIGFKSKSREV